MTQQPQTSGTQGVLRDARLAQALQNMPDAQLLPDAQVRRTVLQAAQLAVRPTALNDLATLTSSRRIRVRLDAWRTWWHGLAGQPGQRIPMTGVLASLLTASFITVLWYGQELPGDNPQSVPVARPSDANDKFAKDDTNRANQAIQSPAAPIASPAQRSKPATPAPAPAIVDGVAQLESAARLPEASAPPVLAKAGTSEQGFESPTDAPARPVAPAQQVGPSNNTFRDASAYSWVRVLVNGQQRALTPAQSSSLLVTLRALPWTPELAGAEAASHGATVGPAGARAGGASAVDKAASAQTAEDTFTVQTSQGERWDISRIKVRASIAGNVSTSPLTQAQWLQLRAFASPALSP